MVTFPVRWLNIVTYVSRNPMGVSPIVRATPITTMVTTAQTRMNIHFLNTYFR